MRDVSAFGVEHGPRLALAKALAPGLVLAPSLSAKPYGPRPAPGPRVKITAEEQAAKQSARAAHAGAAAGSTKDEVRAAQEAANAAKFHTRVAYAKPLLREHFAGRVPATAAVAAGVGVGSLALLHRDQRRHRLGKAADRAPLVPPSPRERREVALGATAGLAGASVVDSAGMATVKARMKIHRAKVGRSPADSKLWREHRAAFGVSDANPGPGTRQAAMHRAYPKALPGWRAQRALAVEAHPAVGAAVLGAGALAGAGLVRRHQLRERAGGRS